MAKDVGLFVWVGLTGLSIVLLAVAASLGVR